MNGTRKQIVVVGASGLVGQELIRLLHDRKDLDFTALVRRPGSARGVSDRVKEVIFDFEAPDQYQRLGTEIPCDLLFCALGTTLKAAGSPEAFRRVDLEYPKRLIERLATLDPKPGFGLVSSLGAGAPKGLYLSTKAELEACLRASGLPHLIARPSLLLGEREEFRLGERLATLFLAKPYLALAQFFAPRSLQVWRAAPIQASQVALSLTECCLDKPLKPEGRILEGLYLHHPILALE